MPLLERFDPPLTFRSFVGALPALMPRDRASEVRELERALGRHLGRDETLVTASAREALDRVLLAASRRSPKRSEVVFPALSYAPLLHRARALGLTPIVVDIDARTLGLDPSALEAALGPHTLAIVVTHAYGLSATLGGRGGALRRLADACGALLIEDGAQAFGAQLMDASIGAHGHAALYSFGPTKPLPALGGGCISTDEARLAADLRALPLGSRATGPSARLPRALLLCAMTGIPVPRAAVSVPEEWLAETHDERPTRRWHEVALGAFEARVVRARLGELAGVVAQRRRSASRLRRSLGTKLRVSPDGYACLLEVDDAATAARALRRHGVDACHGELLDVSHGACPTAARLAARLLRLPVASTATLRASGLTQRALASCT